MNVLILINKVPYPPKDGGAIATFNLIRSYVELGHRVTVLAMNTDKHRVELDAFPQSVRDMAKWMLVDVPAKITFIAALRNLFFSNLPYNAERFIVENYHEQLKEVLTAEKFDVVQLEGLYVCPYIPLIRKLSGALIAYRSHNIESEIWERKLVQSTGIEFTYLKVLQQRLARFEQSFVDRYDILVPITERDGRRWDEWGNSKPQCVCPTGLNVGEYETSEVSNADLFHLGALDWAPNQEGLLWFLENCWAKVLALQPQVKLHIAGRNCPLWLEKEFQKYEGLVYHGEVDDARDFMNKYGIMIVPLLSGSGMRIKIIEGLALKKAIVSTPVGAEGIDVVDGIHIQIAEKEDGFVHKVVNLVQNHMQLIELGENGRKFVELEYDNLSITKRLAGFLQNHLSDK
ncbi:glycosyltransferase [Puteibacter caeruleilacunae]|nr:glycosyltransferase [Puteibacter caeruleilacunae]